MQISSQPCRRLVAAGGLPDRAGQPTQIQLHLTLDQLRSLGGAAAAEAAWAAGRAAGDGEPGWLSGRAAEAYACDALITPLVTGHVNPAALAGMTAAYLVGRRRPGCACGRCTCPPGPGQPGRPGSGPVPDSAPALPPKPSGGSRTPCCVTPLMCCRGPAGWPRSCAPGCSPPTSPRPSASP